MLKPQLILGLNEEITVDLFAGGGGASTGIEQAIGRHVDVAVNHDPETVTLTRAEADDAFARGWNLRRTG